MNKGIILEEEIRLKRERWLVEEQMRHFQEKHKMRMKEQKCLSEERYEDTVPQAIEKVLVLKIERAEILSGDPDAAAQPVTVEEEKGLSNIPLISAENETYEEKEETPVDVMKDKAKCDVDLVILSKQRVDLDDDEIGEEKSKLPKRKLKKLSIMTGAKLQQKMNLKVQATLYLYPSTGALNVYIPRIKEE
ncbi:hypothetical protein TNCV_5118301 [Trichonephila clavipes]|nr:hypothetical protein TNCV_5118301 [Trichonephila clavipes]